MTEDPVLTKIAEDARGASWSIMLPDGQEVVLIHTKAGFRRGGHSHNVPEVSVLLSGEIYYRKRSTDGEEAGFVQGPGGVLENSAGEAHLATFAKDSWLVDMRPGSKADEVHNTNYPPWRALVDAQLGNEV